MVIRSTHAIIIYTIVMVGAFIYSSLNVDAPFLAFATQFTLGFIAYITKRLVQNHRRTPHE